MTNHGIMSMLAVDLRRRQAVLDRDRRELQDICTHPLASRATVALTEYSYYVACSCATCGKTWQEQ